MSFDDVGVVDFVSKAVSKPGLKINPTCLRRAFTYVDRGKPAESELKFDFVSTFNRINFKAGLDAGDTQKVWDELTSKTAEALLDMFAEGVKRPQIKVRKERVVGVPKKWDTKLTWEVLAQVATVQPNPERLKRFVTLLGFADVAALAVVMDQKIDEAKDQGSWPAMQRDAGKMQAASWATDGAISMRYLAAAAAAIGINHTHTMFQAFSDMVQGKPVKIPREFLSGAPVPVPATPAPASPDPKPSPVKTTSPAATLAVVSGQVLNRDTLAEAVQRHLPKNRLLMIVRAAGFADITAFCEKMEETITARKEGEWPAMDGEHCRASAARWTRTGFVDPLYIPAACRALGFLEPSSKDYDIVSSILRGEDPRIPKVSTKKAAVEK